VPILEPHLSGIIHFVVFLASFTCLVLGVTHAAELILTWFFLLPTSILLYRYTTLCGVFELFLF
jgi:hypothetical protein